MNFLEQLVAEWYGYRGHFVRTNVRIGKRKGGGWEGEMDVVAFDPNTKVLTHIETSGDAAAWEQRRISFQKKFETAARYYTSTFRFPINRVEKVAIVGPIKPRTVRGFGNDITVLSIPELMRQIKVELVKLDELHTVVPESYPLLRAIQFAQWEQ